MRYVSKITFGKDLAYRFDISSGDWAELFDSNGVMDETHPLYNCTIEITNSDDGSKELFRFSDYPRYEACYTAFDNLVESGITGVEDLDGCDIAVYAIPKRSLALRSCIKFIHDTDKVPHELSTWGARLGFVKNIPSFMRVTENGNILFTFEGDYDTTVEGTNKYRDVVLPESLIMGYLDDFGLSSQKSIDVTVSRVAKLLNLDEEDIEDLNYDFNMLSHVDFNGYWYRTDALFQCLGYPLYIDKKGFIYLGYTEYDSIDDIGDEEGITGVLKYKITDLKKFRSLVSKSRMLKNKEV